jgi:hypothetical protein
MYQACIGNCKYFAYVHVSIVLNKIITVYK